MPLFLLKIVQWLLSKGIVLAVIAGIAVCVFAFWIFVTKSYTEEGERVSELVTLQGRASEVYSSLESTHDRLIELGGEIEETRQRIEAANRVIQYFDGILNRIERYITMSAQERAESERRLEEAKRQKEELSTYRKILVGEQSDLRIGRIELSEEAKDLETRIQSLETQSSDFLEHLGNSWNQLKPYLLWGLAGAVFIPPLWKLFAYYVWAPLLCLAGPIRLERDTLDLPRFAGGGVSNQVSLEQGQKLWVKESYLQSSDETLKRRTRFVLNWSIPATCLAAGLVEMIELSAEGDESGKVTVSPQNNAELELAVVELPESCKMVVRPSCVVGLVSRSGDAVTIARRWRLFHPQAWLTLQFRYFVFEGPATLIVSGIRGVRFELMDSSEQKGRRSNQVATIGFTPDLSYGVVKAETFWSYFRGFNPLFDDVFRGRGAFLCQEISEREASRAGRFWSGVWNGLLKVLGV